MPSTILSDNGVSSGSAGLKSTAGNDGTLLLQTTTSGGTATTALAIDTSQNISIGGAVASQKLNVKGVVNFEAISGSTNGWFLYTYTDNTYRWNYNGSGADELVLNTNGVVALKNASTTADGIGITFPATQSASSDANTLDDYEEGTWTPTITYSTVGTLSVTYSFNGGKYIKIGKLVYLQFDVRVSTFSKGTASGTWGFAGAPFAAENSSGYYNNVSNSINFYNAPLSANPGFASLSSNNGTVFFMYTSVSNSVNGNQSDPVAGAIYQGTLTYLAAS